MPPLPQGTEFKVATADSESGASTACHRRFQPGAVSKPGHRRPVLRRKHRLVFLIQCPKASNRRSDDSAQNQAAQKTARSRSGSIFESFASGLHGLFFFARISLYQPNHNKLRPPGKHGKRFAATVRLHLFDHANHMVRSTSFDDSRPNPRAGGNK